MATLFVVVKIPRSLWQLFHIALRRDGVTMQAWVEGAVRKQLNEREIPSSLRGVSRRRRTTRRSGDFPSGTVAEARSPRQVGAPPKQIIARVDTSALKQLRSLLEESGISLTGWLLYRIEEYLQTQPLTAVDMLPTHLLKTIGKYLPASGAARESVASMLLDWGEEAVIEAASDRAYGLAETLRAGDIGFLSQCLSVAAKSIEARKQRDALVVQRVERRRKAAGGRDER